MVESFVGIVSSTGKLDERFEPIETDIGGGEGREGSSGEEGRSAIGGSATIGDLGTTVVVGVCV